MFSFLQQYPYLALLITTIIEGPIATFISAGLAAHHVLRLELVILITIIGDVIGDLCLYLIGKYLSKRDYIARLIQKIPKKQRLHAALEKHPFVCLLVAKITPYLATPTLIFAGFHRFSLGKFLLYSCIISLFVKAVYVTLGYIGAVSIQQVIGFTSGWKMAAGYFLLGGLFFWGATRVYYRLGGIIKKKLPNQ